MRTTEGFIICYSVTDKRSFEEALEYKKLIDRVRNKEDVPVVLVGNKCDLEETRRVRLMLMEKMSNMYNGWDKGTFFSLCRPVINSRKNCFSLKIDQNLFVRSYIGYCKI